MKKTKKQKENSNKISPKLFISLQWRVLRELLRERKLATIGIIIFAVMITMFTYIEVKFLEYATDSVYLYYSDRYEFSRLILTFALFFALLILVRLITNFYNKIRAKYDSKISFIIDRKITSKISEVSYEYFESMEFYEKISLASKASGQYPNAVYGIVQIIEIISSLVVYSYILSELSFVFTITVIISIVLCAIISAKVTDKQLDHWRNHVSPEERRKNYFCSLYSNRVNQSSIQTKNAYPFFAGKYHTHNEKTRKNYLKLNGMSFITELLVTLLFIGSFLFTAITVSQQIVKGSLNLGYYTMVIAALTNLFWAIKKFVRFVMQSNWYVKVLSAYYEVLNFQTSPEKTKPTEKYALSLKNVEYKYAQSNHKALDGVNLDFSHNNKIAIVGANGSGKSTCVLVILEMLKNYSGDFYKDKVIVTAVLQDFMQYQMTIKENIEIGVGGKTLPCEKIQEILKKVDLYDFVNSKPDGINTPMGQLEQGENLSIGQWQRIAIARLLANEEASVWILDEPTAHLDPIAEIQMYKLIFDLACDKLVIFISHRLGFARMANHIVVFENGRVAEAGGHEVLMRKDGIYKKMFELQRDMYS